MVRTIDLNVAHVRIGWEPSPDNFQLVRYHVLSSDHNRIDAEARLKKFQEQLSQVGSIVRIRVPKRLDVEDHNMTYIWGTFDSRFSPSEIDFRSLGRNIIKDYRFCERLVGDVQEYLENTYGKRKSS